jgi:hypothetical protein
MSGCAPDAAGGGSVGAFDRFEPFEDGFFEGAVTCGFP